MSAKDVIKMIEDQDVKFIDFRFTDTIGKEQHVSVPAHTIDVEKLEDGQMFDGSSISGWKTINDSDMILSPDTETAVLDPFTEEVTLNIRCNIIEPSTLKGYVKDPRSIAQRAEEFMKSSGLEIQLILETSLNFLCLTVSSGIQVMEWVRHSMKLILKRLLGILEWIWKVEIKVIVLKLRVVTFQFHQLIHCMIFAPKCV
jgi:glutamine synthetase